MLRLIQIKYLITVLSLLSLISSGVLYLQHQEAVKEQARFEEGKRWQEAMQKVAEDSRKQAQKPTREFKSFRIP
jgi:hypothetical protein